MTKEEKQKAIDAIKISAPFMAMTQEEYNIYIQTRIKLINWLEQEPCEDCISRQAVLDALCNNCELCKNGEQVCFSKCEEYHFLATLPPVNPQKPKIGHCKDCKYFEYDHVENVDGIMLIVAHEFCKKWGDGCKTNENGYCFLFEPKERAVNE